MLDDTLTLLKEDAIAAEQVKAYFKDANDLNFAGAAVFSLMIYVVHDQSPWWTWGIPLSCLYLVTAYRVYLVRQYRQHSRRRNPSQWIDSQALTGGLAGLCWGIANLAMLAHLTTIYQLFILAVSAVSAATATTEGFSITQPPRNFIIASIAPPAIWLFTFGDRLHTSLALLLFIFIPITASLINKKNLIFIEAQRLRFNNESMAEELVVQHRLAEQGSNAKSRFLAAASHDLRQPLAALILFLYQLESEHLSAQGKFILEQSQRATDSLHNLLESLLDISRLDGHAVKPTITPLAIQRIFNELNGEFHELASANGVNLNFVSSSAIVWSDQLLLGQILRNLVSNAIRYTHTGRILVGCRRRNGRLDVEIHDTGVGIAEEHLPKIFDEFFQVANKERDRRQGLGLGLSIVDRATKLLKHPLKVASKPGKGSSFALTLPLVEPKEIRTEADSIDPLREVDLNGKTILFVENEGDIREGIRRLLQSWGCQVMVAASSEAMLQEFNLKDSNVDLIISDYGLSESESGIEAIKRIRLSCGERPALLFTGNISKETIALAKAAGIPILYKPAKPAELRVAITAAVANFRSPIPAEQSTDFR